jgi:hypothetical protein
VRRGLLGLLGAVSVLSVVVLWVPQRAGTLVQAIESRRPSVAGAGSATDSDATVRRPLPTTLERMTVEPAQRDPFSDAPALAAASPGKTAPVVAPPAPAPVPAPVARPPALQWRLMGTMATPAGQRLVMLMRGDESQTVIAEAGVHLDGGYEITSVTADAVRLFYPPTQTELVIPIPSPQAAER